MDKELHLACKNGDLEKVKHLVQEGADPVECDQDGNTAYHYCCMSKDCPAEVLSYLISSSTNSVSLNNRFNANATEKDLDVSSDCIDTPDACPSAKKYSLNAFNSEGYYPLHLACKYVRLEHVKVMTSSPTCEVNVINRLNGHHSLHILCGRSKSNIIEIAKHLITEKQCDLNVCDKNGYTPLGLACKTGSLALVKLLTNETRCNINEGIHPLLIISTHRWIRTYIEVVSCLTCKRDCNINVQNSDGDTALHLACKNNDYFMVKHLISRSKSDINILNKHNQHPLHLLLDVPRNKIDNFSSVITIVKQLVKTKDYLINVCDFDGNTPLHKVCTWKYHQGSLQLVKFLTALSSCDVNAKNNKGQCPIHLAAQEANIEVFCHLTVECECDLTAEDNNGKNVLEYGSKSAEVKELFCVFNGYSHEMMDTSNRVKLYHYVKRYEALKRDGYVSLKVVKCLLTGPPGAGKSTLKRRFLNESLEDDFSTGVVSAAVPVDSICKPNVSKNYSETDSPNSQTLSRTDTVIVDEENVTGLSLQKSDSFRKLGQQSAIVPSLSTDSSMEWRKQDIDEEAVYLLNATAALDDPITVFENDESDSEDDESDENSGACFENDVTGNSMKSEFVNIEGHRHSPPCAKTPILPLEKEEKNVHMTSDSVENEVHSDSEIDETIESYQSMELHENSEIDNSSAKSKSMKTKAVDEISKYVEKIPSSKKEQYITNSQDITKDDHASLYIIDTGGQPEFHEMLPALITGPAVNLLVFNLIVDLQDRYEIMYRSSAGNSEPYRTSLTHEEVIFRSLASISCLRHNTIGWEFDELPVKDNSEPAAFLIATHRDCVKDDKVNMVNNHLKLKIQSSELFRENLIQFSAPETVIFALDTTKDQKEIEDLKKSIHHVINTRFYNIKLPVTWCALSLKLKRRKQSLYKYQTCFKLAQKSGIESEDDFKAALWYLHNRVGTIMYYPDVKGLEDIIITNLQLVFDRITELITSCFTFTKVGPSAQTDFQHMGMFSDEDIKKLSCKGDPLTPKRLVTLLKHLHIVAGPISRQSMEKSYFMPCALKPAKIESEHRNESSTPAPLLIWFECGYCPVGVVCGLVVYLLDHSEHTGYKWELDKLPHYRNKITFTVGKHYDHVTILTRATYIEVWVDLNPALGDSVRLEALCQKIHAVFEQGINIITKSLHYTYKSRHYFGFPCSCSSCETLPPHPAICEHEEPVAAKCVLNKDTMVLKDHHLIWFKKVSHSNVETICSDDVDLCYDSDLDTPLGEEDISEVCEILSECNEWFELGIYLGLKHSTLKRIEDEKQRAVSRCKIDTIQAWLRKEDQVIEKRGPTWRQLIHALKRINNIALCEQVLASLESKKVKRRRHVAADEETSAKKRRTSDSSKSRKRTKSSHDRGKGIKYSHDRGKGPASGKPFKRKRTHKEKHDFKHEQDSSDLEPSPPKTPKL